MTPLEEARQNLEDFLEKHQHLREYQREIESVLDGCDGPEARLEAISILLLCKLTELQTAYETLKSKLDNIGE